MPQVRRDRPPLARVRRRSQAASSRAIHPLKALGAAPNVQGVLPRANVCRRPALAHQRRLRVSLARSGPQPAAGEEQGARDDEAERKELGRDHGADRGPDEDCRDDQPIRRCWTAPPHQELPTHDGERNAKAAGGDDGSRRGIHPPTLARPACAGLNATGVTGAPPPDRKEKAPRPGGAGGLCSRRAGGASSLSAGRSPRRYGGCEGNGRGRDHRPAPKGLDQSSSLSDGPTSSSSTIRPAFLRTACSISSEMSGLALRNSRALSRPWPIRWEL
jgi:hypothetical protein